MSIIDVFWVARDPEFITRGYADAGFLEDVLNNREYRPAGAYDFRHFDVTEEMPHHDGAVVCFNGMANAADAEWLIGEIDKMRWSLVVIMGNEMWDFPWRDLPETPTRKVWVMNPTPEHAELSGLLPGGPYPNTKDELRPHGAKALDRTLEWFFAGQVTNSRRKECVAALATAPGRSELIKTDRFMGGIPSAEYNEKLASAKAIPCPSGPMTLDANRPLAAMEAGCVPILDMRKPKDPQFDYWELVFGPGYPMPVVFDWQEVSAAIDQIKKNWPAVSNTVFAWWQQWKRSTIVKLHQHIRDVSGIEPILDVDDRITAIITTSPIPSHPDDSILVETVEAIRAQLPHAEIIVAFDGIRSEQWEQRADYQRYIQKVLWRCNFEWRNVLPMVMPEWGHQANTTREALKLVNTDTILFVEHDTPVFGDIPWAGLITQVENGVANAIRLHQDVEIHPDHRRIVLDSVPQMINGIPMVRTSAWWQRPHLAATDFYQWMLDTYIHKESRTMIEDRVYPIMFVDCSDRRRGWARWKVWIYHPDGDIRRSGHSDGRQDQPKWDMLYEPVDEE